MSDAPLDRDAMLDKCQFALLNAQARAEQLAADLAEMREALRELLASSGGLVSKPDRYDAARQVARVLLARTERNADE